MIRKATISSMVTFVLRLGLIVDHVKFTILITYRYKYPEWYIFLMVIPKLVQCPICGHIWTPRVPRPRYCARCRRYLEYLKVQIDPSLDKWERLPDPGLIPRQVLKTCTICGREVPRGINLSSRFYCRYCVYKLLDEDVFYEPLM